jgi:hypothetical protein
MLFHEIQIPLPVSPIVWCDNMSALSFVANLVYHARTKHIEVDYHYVREKVLNKDITVSFISIVDQIVDIFTKGLSSTRFLFSKSKLKVISFPFSLRGHVKVSNASDPPKHIADDHAVDTANVPAALCNYPRARILQRDQAHLQRLEVMATYHHEYARGQPPMCSSAVTESILHKTSISS